MEAIRLRNIRALGDTGDIEIRPITLLLGQNSSGKSTALRAIPLLKQSFQTRSNAPVLWYGDLVDFGSAKEVRSAFRPEEPISFEFDLGVVKFPRSRSPWASTSNATQSHTRYSCDLHEVDGKTRLRSFTLKRDDDILTISVDIRGNVEKCEVNGINYSKLWNPEKHRLQINNLVPQIAFTRQSSFIRRSFGAIDYGTLDSVDRELTKFFSERLSKRVRIDTIENLPLKINYQSGRRFEKSLEPNSVTQISLKNLFLHLKSEEGAEEFDNLRALMMLFDLPSMLSRINHSIERTLKGVSYVGPSRATGERYYRMQELAVDQIDPQGRNLAMFLNSLNNNKRNQFSEWLLYSFGYAFKLDQSTGHIQLHLRAEHSDRFYNLADMGYGFSQVLPIMAEIWSRISQSKFAPSPSIIAMEQPELHLHPAYQARLADVFCNAVTSLSNDQTIKFVIETHSEAIVNRIGALIFDEKISADDVAIYIFDKGDVEETTIRSVRFDDNGILQNWPIGFFNAF